MSRVAAIIPAYNEGTRIASVLRAVVAARNVDEVWVVDDGSADDTVAVARSVAGVQVISLAENCGKGAAMVYGVRSASAPIILFLDADLVGLTSMHVELIVEPLIQGRCDMSVGVFRGGTVWSDTAQRLTPFLSGQRAMRKTLFETIPEAEEMRLGIEAAITRVAHRRGWHVIRVPLRGVSHTHKEQKIGLVKGATARAKMYIEIGQAVARTRRPSPKNWRWAEIRRKKKKR